MAGTRKGTSRGSSSDNGGGGSIFTIIRILLRYAAILAIGIALLFNIYGKYFPHFRGTQCNWHKESIQSSRILAFGDPQIRGTDSRSSARVRLDIWGNDLYLGHIYKILVKSKKPSVVAVLGDLLSSQWIDDDEFSRRSDRYRNRIFPPVPGVQMINVSGNHDVGYSGEMNYERVVRYVREFGRVNFLDEQDTSTDHPWRIIVINSLSMDGPHLDGQFEAETRRFLDYVQDHSRAWNGSTVLMTHLPLYKPLGICSDEPMFAYWPTTGGLRSQNHLSLESSQFILDKVFGSLPAPPTRGTSLILTGHDHQGCRADYTYNGTSWTSSIASLNTGDDLTSLNRPGIREYTVRSMMGEFGGNAGFISGVYDTHSNRLNFHLSLCRFGLQHIWWTMHISTIVAVILSFLTIADSLLFR